MLDHPAFVRAKTVIKGQTLHFDQCMTRDDPTSTPQKKTVLFFSPGLSEVVRREFGRP